jgi:hypothetical protein
MMMRLDFVVIDVFGLWSQFAMDQGEWLR